MARRPRLKVSAALIAFGAGPERDAALTVILGVEPVRDHAELRRLELPALDSRHLEGALAEGYTAAGFIVTRFRALPPAQLAGWPSTWARHLALGGARSAIQIEARARRYGFAGAP